MELIKINIMKYISFLVYLTIIIQSCDHKKQTDGKLDLSFYEVENYNKKVTEFIQKRTAIDINSDFDLYVANTSNCNSCSKSNFENLMSTMIEAPSFSKIYVLVNDSVLINKELNNDEIEFIYRDVKEYKEFGIFHSKIYLYQYRNGALIKTSEI